MATRYDIENEREEQPQARREQRDFEAHAAERRRVDQRQRVMVIAGFSVAVSLLVVCLVMIFSGLLDGKGLPQKGASSQTAISSALPGIDSEVSVSSLIEPAPSTSPAIAINTNDWNLRLINATNPMPADYTPELGNVVVQGAVHQVDARAADQLQQMLGDCNAAGNGIVIYSGYRSYSTQQAAYDAKVAEWESAGYAAVDAAARARESILPAAESEMSSGLAVDFLATDYVWLDTGFADTAEFQWLMEHAASYGFVLRYPADKTDVTGVPFQPWHWRYVGVEHAQAMKASGQCLEEYIAPAG